MFVDKTAPVMNPIPEARNRKVILAIFDAMREDMVEWNDRASQFQKLTEVREHSFKGEKIHNFKTICDANPDNCFFMPASSEMPTLTTVRQRATVIGGLNSHYEMTANFEQPQAILEDNIVS